MNRTNLSGRLLTTSFGAFKKVVAKIMDIKRLKSGADFAEYADTAAPLVGKRRFNMGDLWREPLDNQFPAEGEPSGVGISGAPHEAVFSPEYRMFPGDIA